MRMILLTAVGCLAAASAWAQPSGEQPILPGYWESTYKVTFPIPDEKTKRECVTEAQIAQYLNGPSNKHYSCRYSDRHVEHGKISLVGDCRDSNGVQAPIHIEGAYTPTSFTLDARMQLVIGGLGIPVTASTDAHRLGAECPLEARR